MTIHIILHWLVCFFFIVGLITSSTSLLFIYLSYKGKHRAKLAEEQRIIEQEVDGVANRYNQAALEVAVLEVWFDLEDTRVERK